MKAERVNVSCRVRPRGLSANKQRHNNEREVLVAVESDRGVSGELDAIGVGTEQRKRPQGRDQSHCEVIQKRVEKVRVRQDAKLKRRAKRCVCWSLTDRNRREAPCSRRSHEGGGKVFPVQNLVNTQFEVRTCCAGCPQRRSKPVKQGSFERAGAVGVACLARPRRNRKCQFSDLRSHHKRRSLCPLGVRRHDSALDSSSSKRGVEESSLETRRSRDLSPLAPFGERGRG